MAIAAARFVAESDVEEAALEWFEGLGYTVVHAPHIAPGEAAAERASFADVVLAGRLKAAIARLNPSIPADAQDEAFRKVIRRASPSLVMDNRAFHRALVDGVEVEYTTREGAIRGDRVRLIDVTDPLANDWLVVNQLPIVESGTSSKNRRRPDILVYVNGLPLAVFELKDPASPNASIWGAFNQLQTYKADIPSLFQFNELLVISDGLEARVGSLTADKERYMRWRTIAGEDLAPATVPPLQVLIEGLFEPRRLLAFVRHFVVFEEDGAKIEKRIAGYHQFHAVQRAVAETTRATGERGDKRVGVVWHTQGSGKSLTMAFYAGRIVLEPAMENPTLVVITDRNDLDDQLFGTFSRCHELLRQNPVQAGDRADLRRLLQVASGGVVFTTIQKFFPEEKGDRHPLLTDRRNVVVIADEAHRSQYDFIDGFARHMRDALPNASFIGFTGTPIDQTDASTRAVFGDYISVYDIERAVEDGATVPIYYEGRLARLALNESERPKIDPEFEEVTEGEEQVRKERLKSRWAQLEAVVGTDKRIAQVAQDLVDHFEERLNAMEGKGLVVCMSRRICVDLYNAIVALRPTWHSDDDATGHIKVVMTGSASDPSDWQAHIRNKGGRKALADRFKDPDDPLELVIVRDMWLTGFDVPSLHTMYVDKPMRAHGLMQAIARVNRVFRDKPGGLVVDYLGLADQLKSALAAYTQGGGRGKQTLDQAEAVAAMLEKYEVVQNLFHGFDYTPYLTASAAQRSTGLQNAVNHIVGQRDGKARLLPAVRDLSAAFALAVPHEEALRIRDELAFFQTVRGTLAKGSADRALADEQLDHAVRQLVSKAVTPEGVVDIFTAAGLTKPDISILSDEFLAEVRDLPQRNLAVELLERLLTDGIRTQARKNVAQARSFAVMLERALRAYQNRGIETAQIIEELIQLAKDMRAAQDRGQTLGLSDDEIAFYDALGTNDSAVAVLGDETLRAIARELVETVKRNTTTDWTLKESARAKLRVYVKRVLSKHGYPPDKQARAVQTVIEQAEQLSFDWAANMVPG